MKADMWPTLPCTIMSMPFIEMPQREEALPLMTRRPPCPVAPAYWPAFDAALAEIRESRSRLTVKEGKGETGDFRHILGGTGVVIADAGNIQSRRLGCLGIEDQGVVTRQVAS